MFCLGMLKKLVEEETPQPITVTPAELADLAFTVRESELPGRSTLTYVGTNIVMDNVKGGALIEFDAVLAGDGLTLVITPRVKILATVINYLDKGTGEVEITAFCDQLRRIKHIGSKQVRLSKEAVTLPHPDWVVGGELAFLFADEAREMVKQFRVTLEKV